MLVSLLIHKTSNWESCSTDVHILEILKTERHWHVIHNPMVLVVKGHGSLEQTELSEIVGVSSGVLFCVANQTAFFLLEEFYLK